MNRKITIKLSEDSINAALKELEQYQKTIKPKLMEVCKRLAEIGIRTAQEHLVLADGNTDATIEPVPVETENGYKVVMSGKDVYFIEFGTGDDVNAYTQNVTVLVAPGSWSETHARKYMNYGFWTYHGVQYEGTPAYMPMYYAGREIRANAKRVIEEVLGK